MRTWVRTPVMVRVMAMADPSYECELLITVQTQKPTIASCSMRWSVDTEPLEVLRAKPLLCSDKTSIRSESFTKTVLRTHENNELLRVPFNENVTTW